jgi:hypothetical protein
MVLVPLQGLAIKAAHACPLQQAMQQLHQATSHDHPATVMTASTGHATAPASIPAARCAVHGSLAWLAMPQASPRAPARAALRLQPPAGAHFSSFIPQQPRRPPLFLFA